jgi:hypothetical protein
VTIESVAGTVPPAPSTALAAPSGMRRLWAEHEEGLLWALAVVLYIPLGVLLKTVVLNWLVGPLFPLLIVYLIPTWIRRWSSRSSS